MIKAIQTDYNGYLFRSRIEARWAVFFDALDIKYEYEKEGFDLGGTYYLPDFWLPELEVWVEIKGADPTEGELNKCGLLCQKSNKKVFLLSGAIPYFNNCERVPNNQGFMPKSVLKKYNEDLWMDHFYDRQFKSYYMFLPHDGEKCGGDSPYIFCECQDCGFVGIEFDGRSDRLNCKSGKNGCPTHGGNNDKGYNYDSERLIKAYKMARSYRF